MKMIVYKQNFEDNICLLNLNYIELYCEINCGDCDGSGVFEITKEDFQTCVDCKGTGKIWVSIY